MSGDTISTGLQIGGTIGSALIGADAASDAASAQTAALNKGIAVSEEAIKRARQDLLATSEPSLEDLISGFQGAVSSLEYQGPAEQQEMALSGALGPEAQQEAVNAFQMSPGQQWLQDQQEQALLRNTAAIGGLGGGNVRTALQQQASDRSNLFMQQQIENLRSLRGGEQQRSANIANTLSTGGGQLATYRTGLGTNLANVAMGGAGQQIPLLSQSGGAQAASVLGQSSALQQAIGGVSRNLGDLIG